MNMFTMKSFTLRLFALGFIGAVVAGVSSFNTSAIVIRHDKRDADAIRLGERFGGVCRVIPDGGCTLIKPNWVLTAAHVARSMRVGGEVQFGEKRYVVKRIEIHRDGISKERGRPPKTDLALVELETAVEKIVPIEIYREKDELGKELFIVGYGDFGTPETGLKHMDGTRRAVTNRVDDAGPRRIFMRFDEPPKATKFEGVGGPGDSGGPALLEKDGKLMVVGVSSGSMNGRPWEYGVIDVYTRVSSYVDWIDKVTAGS